MADNTLNIDVVDMTVPSASPVNIAIINQPNPVSNYMVSGKQIQQLIQIPKYLVTVAGTNTVVSGTNLYDYFPELNPSGGGGGGGGGSDNYTPIAPGPGEIDDLNNYTDNGNYIVIDTTYPIRIENLPPISTGFVMSVFKDTNSGYVRQEISPLSESTNRLIRTFDMNTSEWTDWFSYNGTRVGGGLVIGDDIACFEDFYFNNEIVTCSLSGRDYATNTTDERIAIIFTASNNYTYPVFIALKPEAVTYSYNSGYNGPVNYNGGNWYYSTTGMAMVGDLVDTTGNVAKYPEHQPFNDDTIKTILAYVGATVL